MTSAAEQLTSLIDEKDPFAYSDDEILALQVEAIGQRLEERRAQIRVLDRRARDEGIDRIEHLVDVVPLLFAHTTYKSYPESFIARGQWDRMNLWLDTLSTYRVADVDVTDVRDVDDWVGRLRAAGHHVFGTSGTTGKCSFLNQTEFDRTITRSTLVLSTAWSTGIVPANDRPYFWLGPVHGFLRWGDWYRAIADAFALPGAAYYLSDEPILAADIDRMGSIRRAIAEGRASAAEIASLEREASERQARMTDALMQLVDTILAHRREPAIIMGMWSQQYAIAQAARARGISDGQFHPETALFIGGGLKGIDLPPDYREQVRRFYGVDSSRIRKGYGMSEMSTGFPLCEAGRYHRPPWVALLVLDKAGERLLNAPTGVVEGRMAFFDVTLDGRWGGLVSGDRVVVDFSSCPCGRPSPTIFDDVVRFTDLPEGDDKLTCAGTIEGYVRGVISE